ncbi:MAG: PorT family protein [Saprospiraceae bacterium]|nr:PorT family protein [Saprospiraceae bacterium]
MKNIGFNKEKALADKGWAAMRQTLDREMPEGRKRRGFFWWWLAPALAIGLGVFYWNWNAQPVQAAPVPPAIAPSGPVAGIARPEHSASDLASLPSTEQSQTASNNITAQRTHPMTQTVMARSSSDRPIPRTDIPATNHLPAQLTTPGVEPGNPATTYIQPQQFFATALLPQRRLELVSHPDLAIALAGSPQTSPPTPKRERHLWDFGLSATTGTRDFSGLHDASLGFTADFQLKRRWGLRSGLRYGYEKLPLSAESIVSAPALYDTVSQPDQIIIEDLVTSPSTSYSNAVPVQVQTQVSAVHRIEMPLLGWWEPVNKWRLYAGGALSYTLKVETGTKTAALSSSELYNGSINDPENRLGNLASQKVGQWRVNLQSGVGFRPSRHIEVGFFVQNNLSEWGSQDNYASFDPNPSQVGSLSYTIKPNSPWRYHVMARWIF